MNPDSHLMGDLNLDKAFYALAEAAPDAIITADAASKMIYCNPAAERILGYESGELLGKQLDVMIPERFRVAHHAGMARFLEMNEARVIGRTVELVALRSDDSEFPIELSLSTWTKRERTFFTAILRDITKRRSYEIALKQETASVALLQQVTAAANEAPTVEQAMMACLDFVCAHSGWPLGHVYFTDSHEGTIELNSSYLWHPAHEETFRELRETSAGITLLAHQGIPGRVLAQNAPIWVEDMEVLEDLPRKVALMKAGLRSSFAFPVLAGTQIVAIMEFFDTNMNERNDNLLSIMGPVGVQLGRVVERVRAKQRMLDAALRDPLTGLPNRIAFADTLRRAIAHLKRKAGYTFAVLFIDLDRFKVVNDSLGHVGGDALLVEMANRLSAALRLPDMVSRMGGDEFAIFIDDLNERTDGAGAVRIANRMLRVLQQPFSVNGEEVFTSASIGVAFGTTGYNEPEELLRDADTAMYRAKNAGKGRVEVFDPQMRDRVMTQLKLENDLRRAIENQEFFLNYQPVICIANNAILGFEALIRWNHPSRGVVSPNDFIEMAEETGLIGPIGWWVLNEACNWLAKLHREQPETRHLKVNVNVSAMQLGLKLVEKTREALAASQLTPGSLKLEITESALAATESLGGTQPLEMLRELGVELLIDDFGTGYSSLARLSKLPIDALKIDRSFITDLATSNESVEIARCIIALAAALGIGVIAEGVETLEQAGVLLNMGCDQAQGFHYSYPLATSDANDIFRSWNQ